MRALILTHVAHEGPGTLGAYLREHGVRVDTIALHDGAALPAEPSAADLVVSMGGPMNVYEDEKFPFLAAETAFLQRAMAADVPVIGICLGAQLIARACGARVFRAPVEEIGWGTVRLTGAGQTDPLFHGLPGELTVLQWHGDTFDVPEGGELVAAGTEVTNQAFRFGRAWGLQFHLEVDRPLLIEWFGDSPQRDAVLGRYEQVRVELDEAARRLYGNLLGQAAWQRT